MTPIPNTGRCLPIAALTYLFVCFVDLFSRLDRAIERLHLFGLNYSHCSSPLPSWSATWKYAVSQTYKPDARIHTIAQKHGLSLHNSFQLKSSTEGKCRGATLTTIANWHRDKTLDTKVSWESCTNHEIYRALDCTQMPLSKHTEKEWDKRISRFSCEVAGLQIDQFLHFQTNRNLILNSLDSLEEGTYIMPIPTQGETLHTLGIIKTDAQNYLIDQNFGIATPKDLRTQATTLFNYYGGHSNDYYSLYKVNKITQN